MQKKFRIVSSVVFSELYFHLAAILKLLTQMLAVIKQNPGKECKGLSAHYYAVIE